MLDSHAHLGNIRYKNAIVSTSILPNEKEKEALKTFIYSTIGILPENLDGDVDQNKKEFEDLLHEEFGIGEVGLDKRYNELEKQKEFLCFALNKAKEYKVKPILHCVGYQEILLSILKNQNIHEFMIHGYTGSYEMAKKFCLSGALISLNPRVEKTKDFKKLLTLPFVTETDMKTSEKEMKTLQNWNEKLSTLVNYDVSIISERRIKDFFGL